MCIKFSRFQATFVLIASFLGILPISSMLFIAGAVSLQDSKECLSKANTKNLTRESLPSEDLVTWKLTQGMRVSLAASSFDLDFFNTKPKLFVKYTKDSGKTHLRSLKVEEKKSLFRANTAVDHVNVIWPLLPSYLSCEILLKTGNGQYETSTFTCKSVPPRIDNIMLQTDNSFMISGYYFSGKGKVVFAQDKTCKMRLSRPFEFTNRRGKANASVMDIDTGQFRFSINPPKEYDSTEAATLTITNKLGSHSFNIPAARRDQSIIAIAVSPDSSGATTPAVGEYTLVDSTPVAVSAETTSSEFSYFKKWTSNDPNLVIEDPLSKNVLVQLKC